MMTYLKNMRPALCYWQTKKKTTKKHRNEFAFCRIYWFNKCQNITNPKAGNNFLKSVKNLHTTQEFGTSWYKDCFLGYRFTHWLRLFLWICFRTNDCGSGIYFYFIYLFFIYCWLQQDINLYTIKSSYV